MVLDASGQNFVSGKSALASVAPTPVFAKNAGDSLAGKPVSDATIDEAAQKAMDDYYAGKAALLSMPLKTKNHEGRSLTSPSYVIHMS